MFRVRVYCIIKKIIPPKFHVSIYSCVMCSKLFLFVVNIWEWWMEQGCCCLPQTLNPRIGDDVT
jgi:hypothetical protein